MPGSSVVAIQEVEQIVRDEGLTNLGQCVASEIDLSSET